MSKEMLRALTVLEEEKGISKDVVITALEAALVSAYKKNYGQAQNVEVEFDQRKATCMYMQSKKWLNLFSIQLLK